MATPPDWEEHAVQRYRDRLKHLREQLGEHASIVEVEALLIQHEHAILQDTLDALSEGVSPPRDPRDA